MSFNLNLLIVGIGSIGGVISAKIIHAGYKPYLLTNNDHITNEILNEGISLTDMGQKSTIPPYERVYTTIDTIPTAIDIAIITVPTTSLENVLRTTSSHIKSECTYILLQNGIVYEIGSKYIPTDHLILGSITWNAIMVQGGTYEKTSPGQIFVGALSPDDVNTTTLSKVYEILSIASNIKTTNNIVGVLWSKLSLNSALNALSAMTGSYTQDILQTNDAIAIFLGLYNEVLDVASKLNIKLEKIFPFNPQILYTSPKTFFLKRWIKVRLVKTIGKRYGKVKSSMLQHLEKGKKTEIDYLNGFVVKKAQEINMEVPLNKKATDIIKAIENGNMTINIKNIELFKDIKK